MFVLIVGVVTFSLRKLDFYCLLYVFTGFVVYVCYLCRWCFAFTLVVLSLMGFGFCVWLLDLLVWILDCYLFCFEIVRFGLDLCLVF